MSTCVHGETGPHPYSTTHGEITLHCDGPQPGDYHGDPDCPRQTCPGCKQQTLGHDGYTERACLCGYREHGRACCVPADRTQGARVNDYETDVPRCLACDRPLPEHTRDEVFVCYSTQAKEACPDDLVKAERHFATLWCNDADRFPAWWEVEE